MVISSGGINLLERKKDIMARNIGTPKNASFEIPVSKAVDVEYRLKMLQKSLSDALMYVNAIDENVFGEEDMGIVRKALHDLADVASAWEARKPAKRVYRKG